MERPSFVLLGGTGGAARAAIPCSVGGVSRSVPHDEDSVDPAFQSSSTYWGRAAKRTKEEILNCRVVCLKSKRGLEGSRERDVHHSNATRALAQTFGAAKHFVPKNSEGESESTKYADIQSEYVGNLSKIKLLESRVIAYDMMAPFVVPKLMDAYNQDVQLRWGDRADGFNLFRHWSKVSLSVVAQFQQDSYEACQDDEDIVSCEWTKELFTNSSDPALTKRVKEKYEALSSLQQGGITYLKIALDEMFTMSDVVITSLQEFFKTFARDGVAKFPHENVALLVQQINAVAERLAEVLALPRDTPLLILQGFQKCSVPEFTGPFGLLLNGERVQALEETSEKYSNSACLERVKKITTLAANSFHSLNVSNQWNIPSNRRHSVAVKGTCDNCGGDHYAPSCPHPRDEAKIKKAKDARAASRGGGGRGGGRGGRGGGRSSDRSKWSRNNSNNSNESEHKEYGNGVQKRGNAWMCYCKKKECGWNHSHTSGFHAQWKRDTGTFALPADHDYWKLSGQAPSQGAGGATGASGVSQGLGSAISTATKSALSGLVTSHQSNTADAGFSSFLSDFNAVLGSLK